MNKSLNFDTSATASLSINYEEKIKENIYTLCDLVEKRNLTSSVKEKEMLLYAIEDTIYTSR